ncbi:MULTISPECIES: accessory Sec system glycosyltransferase GtfA [Staphylococcus]|uniref:UDP-N-acetylglucosamine--peptide N-acetylglucosaminyltransferase GtfA subunit n=1 Tax=Staphylococcus nepalensis TaxID=214473 RepID=A0A380GHN1_9STAP|nr:MULTISPECIES: accessory Sec system glycosyltransferase GtfA [Staphylococcus]VDG65862.1 glycosyltransferase [Lacrimispora indolis]NWN86029.1 accessory Sec system glycosyltransferase GtfA [Staphylococcus sp.]PNZ95656.1 accessory Sec system glycosyltransferase GtfA [Staphylococcus nepalensis]SUM53932.1 glycosyltransferase [Staphylococcus nepalensis]GGB94253.1 glycosyltransferase Gtf1 [Staphylococcus nepalensis]
MTVYNINFGIGWASSGVEYAQLYRAQALREKEEKIKFVFLDFINNENIQTLTQNLGFNDDEVIWLYQFFTDIKIAPTSVKLNDIIQLLNSAVTRIEDEGKVKKYFFNNDSNYIVCYMKNEENDVVDRVDYISRGKLLRKDYYSYVRLFSEYFTPEENVAKLYMRVFYNEDGSVAYNEYLNENDSMFVFKDKILYSKLELITYFMEKLQLSSNDIILLDRSKDIAQTILQNKKTAKLGVVIHAEHFNVSATNKEYILWNNHYEYVFNNCHEIDFFITATAIQKGLLESQFEKYNTIVPKIYIVPVGNLKTLNKPIYRKPYSIITASRLANEKHVDWLVKAVVLAKKQSPEITFDIYGEGAQKQRINNLIHENNADNYINLHGHVNLNHLYEKYELFISGSTSEGFGLTLMEAVGSGLGLIGFNVNYGNPTFIEDHENGYLIPIKIDAESESEIVKKLAESIIQFFKNDTCSFHDASYKIAEYFTLETVKGKWDDLIEEVLYD